MTDTVNDTKPFVDFPYKLQQSPPLSFYFFLTTLSHGSPTYFSQWRLHTMNNTINNCGIGKIIPDQPPGESGLCWTQQREREREKIN